jgi:hypothetical protein
MIKLVSLERFELSPPGPKPGTLPGYAIESLFFYNDLRQRSKTLFTARYNDFKNFTIVGDLSQLVVRAILEIALPDL